MLKNVRNSLYAQESNNHPSIPSIKADISYNVILVQQSSETKCRCAIGVSNTLQGVHDTLLLTDADRRTYTARSRSSGLTLIRGRAHI